MDPSGDKILSVWLFEQLLNIQGRVISLRLPQCGTGLNQITKFIMKKSSPAVIRAYDQVLGGHSHGYFQP